MIDAAAKPDAIGGKPLEQGTEVYVLSGKEHQWVAIYLKPYADGRLDVKVHRLRAAFNLSNRELLDSEVDRKA
jgi:hypothetical protein